jgi:hypothetical protein
MKEAFDHYPGGFDSSQFDNWSRSYYTFEGHMNAILLMDRSTYSGKPVDSAMRKIDEYCQQYFNDLPRVQSMDFHQDLDKVPFEPTSSAGVGFQGKKGDPGNHESAINRAYATIKRARREGITEVIENSSPDMAFTRTQLTKLTERLKIRNVFGQSFPYIILEGLTAHPLMEMFSNNETFFFVGKDPRIWVPRLLEKMKQRNSKLMSIDWSYFDTTAEPWEISDAFDLLRSILEFPNEESEDAFEFSKVFFINRKIAAPNSTVYFKQCAVPSGSFFTMIIDSIVNWRRLLYLFMKVYGYIPRDLFVQGDDGIVGCTDDVSPYALATAIPRRLSWVLNPEKCYEGYSASQTPYLQRTLKWGDQARDVSKVEKLAIYPEYEVDDPQISSYRARALWEDCNYESLILGFATLYLEEKYGVPTDVPRRQKHYWEILFGTAKTE